MAARTVRESSMNSGKPEQGLRPSANWFAAERRPEGSQTGNVWIEINLDSRTEGAPEFCARLRRAAGFAPEVSPLATFWPPLRGAT